MGISYDKLLKEERSKPFEHYPPLGTLLIVDSVCEYSHSTSKGYVYFFEEINGKAYHGMYEDDLILAAEFEPLLNALREA